MELGFAPPETIQQGEDVLRVPRVEPDGDQTLAGVGLPDLCDVDPLRLPPGAGLPGDLAEDVREGLRDLLLHHELGELRIHEGLEERPPYRTQVLEPVQPPEHELELEVLGVDGVERAHEPFQLRLLIGLRVEDERALGLDGRHDLSDDSVEAPLVLRGEELPLEPGQVLEVLDRVGQILELLDRELLPRALAIERFVHEPLGDQHRVPRLHPLRHPGSSGLAPVDGAERRALAEVELLQELVDLGEVLLARLLQLLA